MSRLLPVGLSILAAVAVLGCSDTSEITVGELPTQRRLPMVGADVSALSRLEALGATYTNGAGANSALGALRAAGHNTFRLRLFVNPNGSDVVVNDLPYTLALAQRIRATGASLVLDLHYSDTWADPAQQAIPAAWAGLSLDSLERVVERYTADVMQQFRSRGILPRIVQVGNEIDGGLLWPLGRIGNGTAGDLPQRAAFGRLLKAGVRGVRQVVASPDTTLVMLHYSQGGSASGARWFFDQVVAEQVPFDVIGLSYYPWWHGSLEQLRNTIDSTASRFNRDVYVVETAYAWRPDWFAPAGANGPLVYPRTPAGQQAFTQALVSTVAVTARGQGVLWWYPEAVPVSGLSVWAGGALGLFDGGGRLLPAAAELK